MTDAWRELLNARRLERERRAELHSEACRRAQLARCARAGESEKRARLMREAWARGAFARRRQGYPKRTDAKVVAAHRMRAGGATYAEIGAVLGVTPYTVGRWLGWERKAEATNRTPITVDGVSYPSLRAAERATGVPRHKLQRDR